MKPYEHINCKEMLDVIKEVFDDSRAKEKRYEYLVPVTVWGYPLQIHICKDDPKDWRVTGFDPTGEGWDEMLCVVDAINDELDRHFY